MLNLFESLETNNQSNFQWLFVVYFLFFLFCDFGRATIVAYDGNLDVEEFPDIELSFTQPIKRNGIEGALIAANPLHACDNISRPPDMNDSINWFVLMSGNSCNFETKVLNAGIAGYSLGIIYSLRARVERTSYHGHYRFYSDMSAVVVKTEHGIKLKDNYVFSKNNRYRIVVFPNNSFSIMTFLLLFSIVAGLFLVIMLAFTVIRFFQQSSSSHNGRLSSQHLRQLQITTYEKGDDYESCVICLEDYKDQDKLRILPCSHAYHMKCIDPWLTNNRRICPVCKRKVNLVGESSCNSMRDRSETTPLLQAGRLNPHGTFNFVNTSAANNLSSSLPVGCGTLHSTHHTAELPGNRNFV